MKRSLLIGMFTLALAGGCIDSKNPLSPPDKAIVDESLLGTWRETRPDKKIYYHIGLAGDKYPAGMLRIVPVSGHDKKLRPAVEYLAFTTTLGGKTILNVVLDPAQVKVFDESGWKADKIDGYIFVKYQLDGDKATVWTTNPKAKEEAIKAGKIQGVVKENNYIRMTDTSENVAKFVASAENLWNAEGRHMERVAPAKK